MKKEDRIISLMNLAVDLGTKLTKAANDELTNEEFDLIYSISEEIKPLQKYVSDQLGIIIEERRVDGNS